MKRKRFDFWEWMVFKDEPIVWVANFIRDAKRLWGWGNWRAKRQGKKMIKGLANEGGTLFVALNGPSIKKQPIERIAGMDCLFVNQGFRLPQYKFLHPKYHVFIDKKLVDGTWDIKWLDEILEMVPDITFVMPTAWSRNSLFAPYVQRGVKILWWDAPCQRFIHGVSGFVFQLAWALGYKKIYVTGYEQTATPAYILKQASHFYGFDPDVNSHDVHYIMKDLYLNARHLACAFRSAAYAKKIGVDIINLTEGGIVDMFRREKFEDVFPLR